MTTSSNNFSFCISEYLRNRYDLDIDERICYLLASPLHLQLLPKSNCLFIEKTFSFDFIENYYIEPLNPLALENFSCNTSAILRIDHNNDLNDIKWIASDYQTLDGKKTLILISNSIFENNHIQDNQPIYALAYIASSTDQSFSLHSLRNDIITVDYKKNKHIKIVTNDFFKHWQINGNEIFNANRYVLIPPLFQDFKKSLFLLLKNSLTKQYLQFVRKDTFSNTNLIKMLFKDLKKNPSRQNLTKHINLLKYSLTKNSMMSSCHNMDRLFFSSCFKLLFEMNIINDYFIINTSEEAGNNWEMAYNFIKSNKNITISEILDLYAVLFNAEKNLINSLKRHL